MESYSRDLLCAIGRGGVPLGQEPLPQRLEAEEVELSLGLSLGGRFGLERKREKLARSSSVAAVLTAADTPATAPHALARTSSLPTKTEGEEGKTQRLEWYRENGVAVEPAARPQGSWSPSSGSSDGEGRRLEVNIADTLMRTSSLPAGIEDVWRKRKEVQSLKRLEVKKKRLERRNSLTSSVTKEAVGQILEEINAHTEKVESHNDVVMGNKQIGGLVNHNNVEHHADGLLPTRQAVFRSQISSFLAMPNTQDLALEGNPTRANEHIPSSVISTAFEGTKGAMMAPPSASALAARTAAIARGEQEHLAGRVTLRAKSMGDVERIMMQEMPCVSTKGLPNGKRVEGFLYKYKKGEEVRIVCVCHGSFLTPAEFVKHAGGGDVAHPLRHIVVNPIPSSFF